MKINNVELNIEVKGDGIPFVWAHGLMGSMALDDATSYFQAKNLPGISRFIRYDARGHGLSPGTLSPEEYHWSNLAKDMIGIADKLDADHFIAGGQSMGSMTALYAALMAPKRVKALILATPSTIWETRKDQAALYKASANIIEAKGVKTYVEMLRKHPFLPQWLMQAKPSDNEKYLQNILKMNKKILPNILRGSGMSDLPSKEEIKSVEIPTLILAWPDDATHPIKAAEELNNLMPESRLIMAGGVKDLAKWPQTIYEFIGEISSKNKNIR